MNIAYNADCLAAMRETEDECIDLTVTSPPYDDIRDYNGYTFDWKATIAELYRITKHGGAVVWIVNDQTVDGSETGTSFRQALWAKDCGFNLHDTMIWDKESFSFPESNRYQPVFEYMFVFTKGKPETFNAIVDKPVLKECKMNKQAHGRDKNGKRKYSERLYESKEFQTRFNIWEYNIGNNITTKDAIAFQHPAIFPERLAADHIKSWSNEGDIVLDPFMGSGTTAKVARALGRHYIGFEISAEYCDIICKRLEQTKTLFDE